MPECRCAIRSFSGKWRGRFVELEHFNKDFVKNTRKRGSRFLLDTLEWNGNLKQSSRDVKIGENRCSQKFHKIRRKAPVPQACNFIKKETLAQGFSCKFCEISKNTFFTEHFCLTLIWAQSRPFSQKSRHFFQFSQRAGEASPLPHSCASVSVWLNMCQYSQICLNIFENA